MVDPGRRSFSHVQLHLFVAVSSMGFVTVLDRIQDHQPGERAPWVVGWLGANKISEPSQIDRQVGARSRDATDLTLLSADTR